MGWQIKECQHSERRLLLKLILIDKYSKIFEGRGKANYKADVIGRRAAQTIYLETILG